MITSRRRGGLLAPALALGLALPARAAAQDGPRIYAPNQAAATISVLDAASRAVLVTVDLRALGFAADARPHHTAVEPDGAFWYASLIGARKVLKFNRDNQLVAQADVEAAGMLVLDPVAERLLVAPSMTAVNPPQRIAVVERGPMRTGEPIDVFVQRPHALAIHPRGHIAYVASVSDNQFVAIDLDRGTAAPISVEGPPNTFVQFAVAPDGSRLVLTGQLSGDLLVFDIAADPLHPKLLTRVHVGTGPYHPAYAPDGRRVYVAVQRENAVAVVDARRWRVERVIRDPSFAQPHGLAPSRDGRWLYVSSENVGGPAPAQAAGGHAGMAGMRHDAPTGSPNGRVSIVDLRLGRVTGTIETGRQTAGLSLLQSP